MDVEMDTSFSDGNGDAMDLGGGSETSRTGRRMAGLRSFRIPLFQPSTVQRTRKTHEDVPFTTMAEPGTCDAPGHVLPGDVEPTMVSISNHFLELAKDKLSVRYIGKGNHAFDVGVIRSNKPFSSRQNQPVAYFEAKVIDAGARCSISIGLSTKAFTLCKHPGSDDNSYGFLDARKSHDGRNEPFGQKLVAGDTVGCGLHLEKMQIFFTLNGKFLGLAFRNVRQTDWYPSVGLHSPNEHVAVNFGTSPFLFDIEGYVEDERRQKLAELGKIPVDVGDMQLLIRGYLLHNAYESTFRTFASSANIALGPRDSLTANHSDHPHKNAADTVEKSPFFTKGDSEKMLFTLERRSELRKLVLSGKAARAMELALQHFPGITSLSFYSRLKLLLLCQIFVETVREGREDRDDRCLEMLNGGGLAEYWRGDTQPVQQPSKRPRTAKEDGKHCSDRIGRRSTEISPEHEEEKRLLEDVTSLLAYPDPAKSPQAWLLGDSQRERVADVLNAAVLASLEPPSSKETFPISSLELNARQLIATRIALREGFLPSAPAGPIATPSSPTRAPSAPVAPSAMSASPVGQRGWLQTLLVASPLPLSFPGTTGAASAGAPQFGSVPSSSSLLPQQQSSQYNTDGAASDEELQAHQTELRSGHLTPPFAESQGEDELENILSEVA